ncbi:AAA family ATPase [Candidatus Palauibacter sp.]|uniref:AAA family ATPase n=1 Tax=Candidatus Palauibacter sp. TaxID=3101350 RepID=UPI003AF26882
MTYLTESAILTAIEELKAATHPFLGITFLACKKSRLPVGRVKRLSLDALTRKHLQQHHRLDEDSTHFFQPFKSRTNWVRGNYASTSLQAINTQTFKRVFLHERGSADWGFAEDYVDLIGLAIGTGKYRRTPLQAIAIWIAKSKKWTPDTTVDDLVEDFIHRYNITPREQKKLFAPARPRTLHHMVTWGAPGSLFQSADPDLRALAHRIAPPPDAGKPDGTLAAIELSKVGPSDRFRLELGERLTVIAGDNGLGKSFLLDVTWWAATRRWANRPAVPFKRDAKRAARIAYELRAGAAVQTCSSHFEPQSQTWVHQRDYPQVDALYVYAGVDGTFSIEDDHRDTVDAAPFNLTAVEIWDGKAGHMEGLIRDWVNWQLSGEKWFGLFEKLLSHLSPSDLGRLRPGKPTRMPGDPRMIPVIEHPYGTTPVPYASAGVRRVMALAYVMVWAWQEHRLASELRGVAPVRRLVLLVDEVEAHLHPFWQRTILPAILEIGEFLDERLKAQMVISTHSPFVLASLETRFDGSSDTLYHLRLEGSEVHLEREDFIKHGNVSSWLTAPIFGLGHARSKEGEQVLDEAVQLQLARSYDRKKIQMASDRLREVLPSDDPFWRRWTYFAEQAGVDL